MRSYSNPITVSGNPATFTVQNAKVLSLSVPIVPTQDLHGYSSPWIDAEYDKVPYNFRAVSDTTASRVGNSELGSIIGGTVAWNQLINKASLLSGTNNDITITADTSTGEISVSGTASADASVQICQPISWIAGHVYYMPQPSGASASTYFIRSGSDIFWSYGVIKKYNATQSGNLRILVKNGNATGFTFKPQLFDFTAMFGSAIADYLYTLESGTAGAGVAKLKSWGFCTKPYYAYDAGSLQSVNTSAHKTYKADNTLLGNYALDSSLTLRGIPKLDANNNLYYDGDSYAAGGTVTRKYGSRAYQNGDATDGSTMITDGTNTVYKLTTTATETATAYAATQSIDPDGTEEYVDYAESQGTRDVAIPVGHDTNYANICPISGSTGLNAYVSPTTNLADATTYSADWTSTAGTVYGGTLDVVTGVLTVTMANIASYNGETINEPWLSSMDAYAAGTTPTTGAQVVYPLATPLTYQLTAQEVELIKGLNNVWADTNTTITLSYALLYFIRQKLIVNGTDLSEYVERDSYRTSLTPVYGQTIETLNGVQHTALLRLRGALKVGLNPQTDTDTATICTALLNTPCQVTYHCLQRDADVTSLMKVDPISAQFLSRCLFLGDEWNDIDDITLTEL